MSTANQGESGAGAHSGGENGTPVVLIAGAIGGAIAVIAIASTCCVVFVIRRSMLFRYNPIYCPVQKVFSICCLYVFIHVLF